MPILSRRSQSQYSRRQTGSGQSFNGERRRRHGNAVHPAKSAVDSHDLTRISSLCRKGAAQSILEHSRTQLPPCQSQDVHNMTSLPEVRYTCNGSGSRTDSGPLCPVPPPSPPALAYYCRPAVVRQRRIPNEAREREAVKRQQRLQVTVTAISKE